MARNNKPLGTKKIDTLIVGKWYTCKYSAFKKCNGSRGDFMSASFILSDENGNEFWVNTPNERSAYKAIGVMTGCYNENGNKLVIDRVKAVKNGKYFEFVYTMKEYIPDINPDEFESVDGDNVETSL